MNAPASRRSRRPVRTRTDRQLPANLYPHDAIWFPDGRRLLLLANEPGHGTRLHAVDLDENLAVRGVRPIAPEEDLRPTLEAIRLVRRAQDRAIG